MKIIAIILFSIVIHQLAAQSSTSSPNLQLIIGKIKTVKIYNIYKLFKILLFKASKKGDCAAIKNLLAGGANVNYLDSRGFTPLIYGRV